MDDLPKLHAYLITGLKTDLVSQFDFFDMPMQSWTEEPKVDWCLQNYTKLPKRDVSVVSEPEEETYELSSNCDDLDVEIEHSDEPTPTYAELTNCNFTATKNSNKAEVAKNQPIGGKHYKCIVCDKAYEKNKTLQDHLKEVHAAYNLVCGVCGQLFHGKRYFKRHVELHSKTQTVRRVAKRAIEDMKIRKVNLNLKEKSFFVDCPKCPAILNSKNALATHIRNVHSDGGFKCEICGSRLKCRSYLYAHMRRVHRQESAPCGVCGKTFRSRRHARCHGGSVA